MSQRSQSKGKKTRKSMFQHALVASRGNIASFLDDYSVRGVSKLSSKVVKNAPTNTITAAKALLSNNKQVRVRTIELIKSFRPSVGEEEIPKILEEIMKYDFPRVGRTRDPFQLALYYANNNNLELVQFLCMATDFNSNINWTWTVYAIIKKDNLEILEELSKKESIRVIFPVTLLKAINYGNERIAIFILKYLTSDEAREEVFRDRVNNQFYISAIVGKIHRLMKLLAPYIPMWIRHQLLVIQDLEMSEKFRNI